MKKSYLFYFFLLLLAKPMEIFGQSPTLSLDKVLIESTNMGQPWGMAFISSDSVLITEKSGKLFLYKISTNTKSEISGVPAVAASGQGGLLDVAIHPDFASNKYVYFSYAAAVSGGYTLKVDRGLLQDKQLVGLVNIFTAAPARSGTNHYGSRITFDDQNHIYISSSERQEQDNAQLLSNHLGKIIRLNDDGTVPLDNPFINENGAKPEIFSYGHRNVQGMVFEPKTKKIYAHEHGPKGGDELNLIEAGKNYGWPAITFGVNYNNTIVSTDTAREGMEQPIRYWVPSIAPCGFAIVPLQNEQNGEINFILGALAGQQIQWVKILNDKHIATYSFMQGYARFRDVEVSPDGKIYALTESPNRFVRLKTDQLITGVDNISNIQNSEFLYPNPAKDFVQIKLMDKLESNVKVNIYNSQGELVQALSKESFVFNAEGVQVNVKGLESGMYLLELLTENSSKTFKWTKL